MNTGAAILTGSCEPRQCARQRVEVTPAAPEKEEEGGSGSCAGVTAVLPAVTH